MIEPDMRPRLARKVRLRFDRHSGRHMLLYPEKGLALNQTAAAVAELCTGNHRVVEIVERLAAGSGAGARARIEQDVHAFLQALLDRNLLELTS